MKIFAIYAKVELIKKPEWLDDFRIKYDKPYPYHLTLKPSTIVEDSEVSDIKNRLEKLFSNLEIPEHKILLEFNSLNVRHDTASDICVMINSNKNDEIIKLQKEILSVLDKYKNYRKEKYKGYAENFTPHITIGRDLNEESYQQALKKLEKDYTCEGIIEEVVLVVMNNATVAEYNDPSNQTFYKI